MQKRLRLPTAQLHRLCSCRSSAALPSRCLCTRPRTAGMLMIPTRHFALETLFKYRVVRLMFISSLLVEQWIFRAVSFALYMMSARSWHTCNSFSTGVLCTARFSYSSATSDSPLGVATGLESSRRSTAVTSRMYTRICFNRVSTSCYHDKSAKNEHWIVQLGQSSHTAHHDLN